MRLEIPARSSDRFALTTSELELVPLIETDAWIRQRLASGGFTSERVETATTTCGWRAIVAYGAVDSIPTLRVFYRFLDLGAFAEVRSDDAGSLPAAWNILAQARPDYAGELAALCQIFD